MFRVEQPLVPHGELDVPPMSVELPFALVLTSLQLLAHLGHHPAHQMRSGLACTSWPRRRRIGGSRGVESLGC